MSVPTERATNHDISTTISISLHCHKLHRGTLDLGLGEECSHVFARDYWCIRLVENMKILMN